MSVALSALSIPIATKRNELGLVEMRELGREKRVTICHQQQCVGSSPFNQKKKNVETTDVPELNVIRQIQTQTKINQVLLAVSLWAMYKRRYLRGAGYKRRRRGSGATVKAISIGPFMGCPSDSALHWNK